MYAVKNISRYNLAAVPPCARGGERRRMSKSIMQGTKECYICRQLLNEQGIFKQLTPYNLEEHHIMHGTANRKVSERYGLKVYLCIPHHRTGDNAVHRCRDMDLYLIRKGQARFEQLYSPEEWMSAFGKNYI